MQREGGKKEFDISGQDRHFISSTVLSKQRSTVNDALMMHISFKRPKASQSHIRDELHH